MLKDDLDTFPAEFVFGSQLTVPGEFVGHGQGEPVLELLQHLHDNVSHLQPVPPVHHGSPSTSSPTSLSLTKFAFIHHNGHKSPLRPHYDGSFHALASGDKFLKFRSAIVRREF